MLKAFILFLLIVIAYKIGTERGEK